MFGAVEFGEQCYQVVDELLRSCSDGYTLRATSDGAVRRQFRDRRVLKLFFPIQVSTSSCQNFAIRLPWRKESSQQRSHAESLSKKTADNFREDHSKASLVFTHTWSNRSKKEEKTASTYILESRVYSIQERRLRWYLKWIWYSKVLVREIVTNIELKSDEDK